MNKFLVITIWVLTNYFICVQGVISDNQSHQFLTIGHRGFAGKYMENSLQGFRQAVRLGLDAVELDVWVCKTGELMVFHDRTLERLTKGTGNIADQTFTQLRKLKLPNGELIPTLQECLTQINHKCSVNIELKGPNTAAPTAKIIQTFLNQGWQAKDFMVSSFNHPELQKFHNMMPQIPFGPITDGVMVGYAKLAQDLGAHYMVVNFEYVTPAFVNDAHARNIKLFTYTVNDIADIVKMKKLGVDGIISNFPNLVMQNIKR